MSAPAATFRDLFIEFVTVRQKQLRESFRGPLASPSGPLRRLLAHPLLHAGADTLQRAFSDPYFPAEMLARTIFSDVTGMRFFINKSRPDLEPVLAGELLEWSAAFVRIRHDIEIHFDPAVITCIPLDGCRHPLPETQWCTLCGVCCQIGGVPPEPPRGIRHPHHWAKLISGDALGNQQLCPFLFQYFGEPRYFCSIHQVKPIACRAFDQRDCEKRLAEPGLHGAARPLCIRRQPGG